MALSGIGQAISASYTAFIFFAYLNAVGTSSVYPLAFIIGILFYFHHFSLCIIIFYVKIHNNISPVTIENSVKALHK